MEKAKSEGIVSTLIDSEAKGVIVNPLRPDQSHLHEHRDELIDTLRRNRIETVDECSRGGLSKRTYQPA